MRNDTGHVTFQKIEGRPGYREAVRQTFEMDEKTGERTDYRYEPLGKIYRLLCKGENARTFSETVEIYDPDFHVKTLVRVEKWCICEHSTLKPDAEPGLCYCAVCSREFTWIPREGLTPAQEEKLSRDSPGTVTVPLDKIEY